MKVSKNQVPDTAYEMLERMLGKLPSVYKIDPFDYIDGEPERFAIMLGAEQVAVAVYEELTGVFDFDFSKDKSGNYLERQMIKIYGDAILWVVLYPWHGAWAYSGEPKATSDLAMADIEDIAFKSGDQPQLVAFRASVWPTQMLKVEHCWLIHGNNKADCRMGSEDGGGQMFLFTVQE